MQMNIIVQLTLIVPELLLAVGAVALLLIGVFAEKRSYAMVTGLAIALLSVTIIVLFMTPLKGTFFHGALILDSFGRYMKILALFCALIVLIMSVSAAQDYKFDRFEFPVLIILASLGMLLMISAGNMLSLYLALELHSLALYVMASLQRDNKRSTEAGLKYFVLGSLASGLLLYGISLLYGFSGHIDFTGIAQALQQQTPQLGLIFGLVFVLAGVVFKISAVPFHMWTPDVYEGAPTPITAFFATASKIAALAMIVRLVITAFGHFTGAPAIILPWQQILIFIALASMFLGAFAGIAQTNIKRLMAYSSITQIGYILVGLSAGTAIGVAGILLYILIYAVVMLGCFAFILSMRTQEGYVEDIKDLSGLSRSNPFMAGIMTLLMLALAGIPPLSGFFAKWYIFSAAVQVHFVPLVVAGVLVAVIAAFYYLRVIKVMWFDPPTGSFLVMPRELKMVMLLSGAFTLFYFILGIWLTPLANNVAHSLF